MQRIKKTDTIAVVIDKTKDGEKCKRGVVWKDHNRIYYHYLLLISYI